ncbi:MAG: 4Fe-4S binding protein, partial [Thermoguttaceae bacterium]|nr:4Fe-4S binding protein [Thermoguttaceae bacterium]
MLRKIRILLAAFTFVVLTLLFLDFTGTIHLWLGWMAKIQFLPALLAVNAGVVAALVLLTLLFGRIYCSVICPLGILQDLISWFAGRGQKKPRFRFQKAHTV